MEQECLNMQETHEGVGRMEKKNTIQMNVEVKNGCKLLINSQSNENERLHAQVFIMNFEPKIFQTNMMENKMEENATKADALNTSARTEVKYI
jgi:hypothetical protein